MASPFAVLRKNQKTLLAVFGVVIMFTFVVGGGVDDYLRNRFAGRVEQAPLVTWVNGAINDQDLAYLRHKHQVAMRFLEREQQLGREVSARWDWIVPPMSGATTRVFHTPMREFPTTPDFHAQPAPPL